MRRPAYGNLPHAACGPRGEQWRRAFPCSKRKISTSFFWIYGWRDRRNRDGKKAAEPESEIRMDKGRVGDTEVTAVKEEKLARLQQRAVELTFKTAEMSGEATEEIKKERAYTKQVPAEEEEGEEEA